MGRGLLQLQGLGKSPVSDVIYASVRIYQRGRRQGSQFIRGSAGPSNCE